MWNQNKYTDTFYEDDVHGQFAFGLPPDGSADQARLTDQWVPGTHRSLIDRIVRDRVELGAKAYNSHEMLFAGALGGRAGVVLAQADTHRYVRRYAPLHNLGSTESDPEGGLMDGISPCWPLPAAMTSRTTSHLRAAEPSPPKRSR